MCGIIAMSSRAPFATRELLERLKRLDYRGYDSYGVYDGEHLLRSTQPITTDSTGLSPTTRCAIAHTRWATHGGVNERNAHPHRAGRIILVHNGIIENWRELREGLANRRFSSDTDSEVIAHLLDDALERGEDIEQAIQTLIATLAGTFALLIMVEGDDRLYAVKRDSPLAIGLADARTYVASDLYAFTDATGRAILLDNDQYAIITPEEITIRTRDGTRINPRIERITHANPPERDARFSHHMHAEIAEQPRAAKRLIESLATEQHEELDDLAERIRCAERVIFTAAGTAYFASLIGSLVLHRCAIRAQAIIASEFDQFITCDARTLVIAVSQSGETMDVIEALKSAHATGAHSACIVNTPHSTIERMCEAHLRIEAGPEIAVASTKAFTNQVLTLLALARRLGAKERIDEIPDQLTQALALETRIKALALELRDARDLYIIGRGLAYPVAREIALKIKEVSYLHAEGMMAGELKHGTLALIEQGTPVIALLTGDARMRANAEEVSARGARIIGIGEGDLPLHATGDGAYALLATICGQLLAYHLARERGLPIDKPRNLAKSVTVI